MPFSISAGVGFVVLFGLSVLDGLVLISAWNELKEEGITNLNERIRLGVRRRLRPVLLTTLTDILGFLPMAVSISAGAEVQQPLATVVIGGMITVTILTLLVLPLLYKWVESKEQKVTMPKVGLAVMLVGLFTISSSNLLAQDVSGNTITSLDKAISVGLTNNANIQVSKKNIEIQQQSKKAALNLDKTDLDFQYGQINSYENDFAFSLSQQFEFPSVYQAQRKLSDVNVEQSEIKLSIAENSLKKDIKSSWYELSYLLEKRRLLSYQDSIYSKFLHAATIRYEVEATSFLEKGTAETKVMELQNRIKLLNADILIQEQELRILLNNSELHFAPSPLDERSFGEFRDSSLVEQNPSLSYVKQQVEVANAEKKLNQLKCYPTFL